MAWNLNVLLARYLHDMKHLKENSLMRTRKIILLINKRMIAIKKLTKSLRVSLGKYHFVIPLSVLVLIGFFLARGWLDCGFPKGDDATTSLPMFWPLQKSLFDELTPISWSSYWYLGHPTEWRLPHLLGIFTFSNISIKLFNMAIFILAGIFMYFFVYEITRNSSASFFSGLFYTFLPYHLLFTFFSGHLSISIAYSVTPLVFLSLKKSSKSISPPLTILTGFTVAVLILTHPQAFPILIGPFIFAYCLFEIIIRSLLGNRTDVAKCAIRIFASLMIGLLLSAYWWVPMIQEMDLFHSRSFSLEETIRYTPSFLELITFRPPHWNSPSTAIGAISSPPILAIRFFVPLFALLALIFLHRNKYVIFFSITGLTAIALGMGVYSPIPLFPFAFENIPFFDGIRTPVRFLAFASFAFSVPAGLLMARIFSRLKNRNMHTLVLIMASLLVIANVYEETQRAFQTFDLEPSQKEAMSWLSEQESGRLAYLPFRTWANTPETRNIVYPWNYVHLHKKEVLGGGAPFYQLQNTADFLSIVKSKLHNEKINSIKLLDVLGVKYVVLDGNYPNYLEEGLYKTVHSDLESSDDFEEVWSGGNVTIFKNLNAFPRVFLQREGEIKKIDVFEDSSTLAWRWAQATQYPARLGWSEEGRNWLNVSVENIDFENFDAINFWHYLPEPQPNIHLDIAVFEKDESRYTASIRVDTSQGWHKVSVPFALLRLADSEDENRQLDKNQIASLWIRASETGNYEENKAFTIYFDNMTLSKYEYIFNEVSFELIHPGKYKVNVNIDEPSYLVLAESYHPSWVAKDPATGKVIARSEPLYIALNGLWLEEGKYELILAYEKSLPQKTGNTVSVVTLIACLGCLAKNPAQKLLRRMRRIARAKLKLKRVRNNH